MKSMPKNKIYNRSWRIRKAYWTAFKVVLSYLWLSLKSKFFGKKYYANRIVNLHLKNANRVKESILELQGLFIKIGQLLSILTNFLPEAFQKPLEALQDQIPARPYTEIEQRITAELGAKPEQLFAHFDKIPIASASIGQAHKATLKDGTAVVVKVQHNNIEKVAETDLEVMEKLIYWASRFYDIRGMEYAYTQVRKMIEEELDFRQEAQAMQQIQENLAHEEGLKIPEIHQTYSTNRILTTTFYGGVKISNTAQLSEWGINRRMLANHLVHIYCQMVFEDGFYHADPHPGNILVQKDGTIVLLDFGAVASLKPETRTGLLELIEAAAKNDTEKIIHALKKLGFIAYERKAEKIAEKVIDAFRKFLENEVQFEGLNLKNIKVNPFESSLFNLTTEIGLKNITNTVQVPKDYVLLNRMVTLLLGICNTLDPHTNPLEVVQPYFKKFILGEKGDLVKYLSGLVQKTITDTIALPHEIRKTLKKIQRGEIEVQVVGSIQKTQLIYALGQQLIYTLLTIATAGFGYLFYQNQQMHPAYYAGGLSVLFLLLLFRAMRKAKKVSN